MSEKKKGSRQSLLELEAMDEEIEAFPIGLGCALDLFREKDEVFEMINSLPQIHSSTVSMEVTYENYQKIIDRYQEQPHLLDRHLEVMINLLLDQFRTSSASKDLTLKHLSLKFLRQLFKVRGPKEVVKRMPHEIADLAPVLTYLEVENLDDPTTWESGYVLVMWLSILVINPFHLKLLDGQEKEKIDGLTVAERLMKVCKKCLVLNNNIGQAAPFLIARFLTRPDMQEMYMDGFIEWACQSIQELSPFGTRVGAFAALSAIFKQAKRQEILKYGEKVLSAVLGSKFEKCDTMLRKCGTKLIQRIGMMFMKTKMAPWRYQRGNRSLLGNLKGATSLSTTAGGSLRDTVVVVESYDELNQYSSAIESVLDKMLEGLKDKDTIVRWSAAKGIGRVTNRLPKDYADEVVEGILQNFSPREGNSAWHGGCLALAELGRRGLLLPERLPVVIPVIKKALIYDEIRGNFSVGSHVRDAACYVLWAFARAFEPDIILPFVHDIATSLIITMVFDRDVNCRRAASAAFQENVGRQGNFPHGIDIVTIADYFAIGVRNNAFTKISIEIAQHTEYTRSLIDHLLDLKYNHFDGSIRELSAEALGRLTPFDTDYIVAKVVPRLVKLCIESDTYTSHGALLSLGSIVVKLNEMSCLKFSSEILKSIRDIVPTIITRKFKASQRGNDLLRQGLNCFIDSCALAKMPYHADMDFLNVCHGLLEDNISNADSITRETAGDALSHFLFEYYYKNPLKQEVIGQFLRIFCENLNSPIMTTRQGYASALGKFPLEVLKEDISSVVNSLISCSKIGKESLVWAESRRDAITALGSIFSNKGFVNSSEWSTGIPLSPVDVKDLYECLLNGMDDYTMDKRGDIGSWVREASMTTLKILTIRLHESTTGGMVDVSVIARMMGMIAKQCVEKIDNVRVHSGKIFAALLHHKNPPIDSIPQKAQISKVFSEEFTQTVNWRSTSATYPKFVELLPLEEYTYFLLEGFVISGGSLSDSVMKDANGAITSYLVASGAMGDTELHRIGNLLLKIFETNLKNDRVTLPLMKFMTQLLQSGTLMPLLEPEDDEFGLNVITLTKNEVIKTNRVEKIVASVELLCETLQGSPAVVRASLKRLTVYLCHAYPRVRLVTSQKIYEALLTYGAEGITEPTSLETAMALLSDTQWDADVSVIRPIRNQICDIFNIPQPVVIKPGVSFSSVI